ncbi:hypothetical protein UCH007_07920 [Dehalococcoides sp. UCH007]|nr:hypothetical protein UCH007_07920 [Dehalococcoides sp. UCH007]
MNNQYNTKGLNDANSPRTIALNELHKKVGCCQKCGALIRMSNKKLKQGKAKCSVCKNVNIFNSNIF